MWALLLACETTEPKDGPTTTPPDPTGTLPTTPVETGEPEGETDGEDTAGQDTATSGDTETPSTTTPPVPGLVGVPAPPAPLFPETIDQLTVVVRTALTVNSGTDANSLSLCLSAVDCFALDVIDLDEFEEGMIDVFSFEAVGLSRALVDRVEIRSVDGSDRWEPSCLEVQFDGERVYSADGLEGTYFGNEGVDELASWIDPLGLHLGVDSCYDAPLTHGPIRGWTAGTETRVWVRTDGTRLVGLRVSESADPADGAVVAWAWPAAVDDFGAQLVTDQLVPGKLYTWVVEVDGLAQSPPRFLQAGPADGEDGQFLLAMGSCAQDELQPIFDAIEETNPDAFFFLGDNHYANSSELGVLRWFYRTSHGKPDRASMMASLPVIAVWDDHDYVGNDADAFSPGGDVALRAFGDAWANPSSGTPEIPGIFFSARRGNVEVFALDDRLYRGTSGILGVLQEDWLVDAVLSSDAVFKVLATGSQWTSEGTADSWASFPVERARLFGRLAGVPGVVLLSGDVHHAELRLLPDPGIGYDVPEFTASPLANLPPNACGSDLELVACYDATNSFVTANFDTVSLDAHVLAEIRDDAGTVVASWSVALADLQP